MKTATTTALYSRAGDWFAIYTDGVISASFHGGIAHEKRERYQGTVTLSIRPKAPVTIKTAQP